MRLRTLSISGLHHLGTMATLRPDALPFRRQRPTSFRSFRRQKGLRGSGAQPRLCCFREHAYSETIFHCVPSLSRSVEHVGYDTTVAFGYSTGPASPGISQVIFDNAFCTASGVRFFLPTCLTAWMNMSA